MSGDPVPLAHVPDATLAGMYQELLRREGIQCMAQAQGPGYGGWGATGFLPHRLLVSRAACETARGLIEETFGGEYLLPLPDAQED